MASGQGAGAATMELVLSWRSEDAAHRERLHLTTVNFWRDLLPGDIGERAARLAPGESCLTDFPPGSLVPARVPGDLLALGPARVDVARAPGPAGALRAGRFYPRGMLRTAEHFPQDVRPCRFLGAAGGDLRFDLAHPLAGAPLALRVVMVEPRAPRGERGGRCRDLGELVASDGPGMQARLPEQETDFFSGDPFARADETDDALFYRGPRLVSHLDEAARGALRELHARFLRPGQRVLDLMASWDSHLPGAPDVAVTGLGLNREELERNGRLAVRIVRDLNREPSLPFPDASFDLCLCALSVEYLVHPVEVFREVGRVLAPGAPLVVTFADRWFPPKAIRLWGELHPFERLGFVLACLRRSGRFAGLATESRQGLPRPVDDPHYAERRTADPILAAWGRAAAPGERGQAPD